MTQKEIREIRKVFRANRGAAARLSLDLGLKQGTISLWLSGKVKSKRIAKAAAEMAARLNVSVGEAA